MISIESFDYLMMQLMMNRSQSRLEGIGIVLGIERYSGVVLLALSYTL